MTLIVVFQMAHFGHDHASYGIAPTVVKRGQSAFSALYAGDLRRGPIISAGVAAQKLAFFGV